MTDSLLSTFGQELQQVTLIPSSGGVFEVEANGETFHSKEKTGDFPQINTILEIIRQKLQN